MQFADILKQLMDERGMSNYRLAKLMPCAQTTVSNWLNGSVPHSLTLKRLSEIFGVTENYLLGEEDASDAEDADVMRYRQAIRERPEMKMLFDAGLKLTPATVRKTVQFLEGLAGDKETD